MSHSENQHQSNRTNVNLKRLLAAAAGVLALCLAAGSAAAPIGQADTPSAGNAADTSGAASSPSLSPGGYAGLGMLSQQATDEPTTQPATQSAADTDLGQDATAEISPFNAAQPSTTQSASATPEPTTGPATAPAVTIAPQAAARVPADRKTVTYSSQTTPSAAGATMASDAVAAADTSSVISSGSGAAISSLGADLIADGADGSGQVTVTVNSNQVLTTRTPYKRVSIGSSEIADVNPIGPTTVLITGKKPGTTQLILWDDTDHSQVVQVTVGLDLRVLQDRINRLIPDSGVTAEDVGGAIALRGRVPNLTAAEEAAALAAPYGAKVLNFLEISGGQQVMLQVRFAEVDRQASTDLGINYGFTNGLTYGASNVGLNQFSTQGVGASGGAALSAQAPGGNPAITLFGQGVAGTTTFDIFVEALRENQLLRVLAEPNLMAMSGQEADFLAGGSFPVPVVQGTGGGTSVTIQYEPYGVKLKFVPVVMGNGRIRLKVSPEVSDLDYANAVTLSGFKVPALTTRNLNTTVELSDGQTFALGGLLKNNQTTSSDVTPLLGDLPVLGTLFRSVHYLHQQTELMVLVTPRLVSPLNPGHVPAIPGGNWRDPTEAELFLNKDLGGPQDPPSTTAKPGTPSATNTSSTATGATAAAQQVPAPLYRGKWGFAGDQGQAAQQTSAQQGGAQADGQDQSQSAQTSAEPSAEEPASK